MCGCEMHDDVYAKECSCHCPEHEQARARAKQEIPEQPKMAAPKKRSPRTPKVTKEPEFGFGVLRSELTPPMLSPGSTMHECLVGDCEWVLVLKPASEYAGAQVYRLAAAVGIDAAAEAMSREVAAWTDDKLREHLSTHDVLEWAETVRDLESANAEWEESFLEVQAAHARQVDITDRLQAELAQAKSERDEAIGIAAQARPVRRRDPMADAMPIPAGIPRPVQDPMREPIIPSDKRAEGQVARKG